MPKGRLYPLTRDELVECTALMGAVRAGHLDAIALPRPPLDILGQQIIAEVGAQEWNTGDLYRMLRRAAPYNDVTREQFDKVLALAAHGVETGRGPRGRYVYHDTVNEKVRGRKGARLAALTSGGAIPEIGDYRVVAEPDDTFIGTVNEDWAVESMAGDIFLLGTHSWQIRRIEAGVVRVRDAGNAAPTIPFWTGEAPARTDELSEAVSQLRARIDELLAAADPDGARQWLIELAGLEPDAATMIVDYIAFGRAVLGAMPTREKLVVERFFDETGGMQLVIHAPYGGRINRAFGLALRKKFCRNFDFELQAAASDDAIVLSLGPHHSFPLEEVAHYVKSHTVEETLQQAVFDAPMFISRWRWNLNRSLLVLRFRGGRRNPPPIQRMEADDLMAAIFPAAAGCQDNRAGPIEYPDHVIVRQTLDDTLHEALDIDGIQSLLAAIEVGDVGVHCVDTTEPSVLAHEILTARPYAFLDDEEFQNRRTNAVSLRRGLPVDLAAIGQLDPEAIARVQGEITPQPVTSDDLHDLLCSLVLVSPRPEWDALWRELVADNRGSRRRRPLVCGRDRGRRRAHRCGRQRRGDRPRARSPGAGRDHNRRRDRGRDGSGADDDCLCPGGAAERRFRDAGPVHAGYRRNRVGGAPAARAHALVFAAYAAQWCRARVRARFHAVPAPLAAPCAGHSTHGRRRLGHDRQPVAGLGSRGRGVGTGAVRAPHARLRAGRARSALSRRRHRLVAIESPAPRRRRARGRAQQGDADLGRQPSRSRLAARRGSHRRRGHGAHEWRDRGGGRDLALAGRVLRGRGGCCDRSLARRR